VELALYRTDQFMRGNYNLRLLLSGLPPLLAWLEEQRFGADEELRLRHRRRRWCRLRGSR
jgi:hypothetical protein